MYKNIEFSKIVFSRFLETAFFETSYDGNQILCAIKISYKLHAVFFIIVAIGFVKISAHKPSIFLKVRHLAKRKGYKNLKIYTLC